MNDQTAWQKRTQRQCEKIWDTLPHSLERAREEAKIVSKWVLFEYLREQMELLEAVKLTEILKGKK